MNILNKLTLKNLKLNKTRTIVTIIGVMLSTALIIAVAGMFTSFQKTLIEDAKRAQSNSHVTFEKVEKEDVKYFINNKNVKSSFITSYIGYAKLDNYKHESTPYLYIEGYTKEAFENISIGFSEGRTPENSNEIIISERVNTSSTNNYKVGDMITLEVGDRKVYFGEGESQILGQSNSYIISEKGSEDSEIFEVRETKEYKIVGIFSSKGFINNYGPGISVVTYQEEVSDLSNVSLLYSNPKKFDEVTKDINNSFEVKDKYNYWYNSDLLRWQGEGIDENTLGMLYAMASIVIGIIIFTSVFVIRNSFTISISEKIRQYGMLSSIGATKKQIKKNVLFEALIIGVIGIILGIILGLFVVKILIIVVATLMASAIGAEVEIIYSIPVVAILLSIILSFITILLSSLKGVRKVSKIEPINAIRNTESIKIKNKKLRTPKLVEKLFSEGGVIAFKNSKRNRKKYRITVISLVVSIAIFISLSSFLEIGFSLAKKEYREISYNLTVDVYYDEDKAETEELYNSIINTYNLENYSLVKSFMVEKSTDIYTDSYRDKTDVTDAIIPIVSVGEVSFNNYLNELGLKDAEAILINSGEFYDYEEKKTKIFDEIYNISVGKKFKINDKDSVEITHITDKKPLGVESIFSNSGCIIVKDEVIDDLNYSIGTLFIKSSEPYKLEENINKNYDDISFYVSNFDAYAKATNSMLLLISIFLYGFIAVIIAIALTNIFNTITTNMKLRSSEFATLKSVGMTKREFNNMVRFENFIYGFKSLLIGIPLGILGSYLLYNASLEGNTILEYSIPYKPIIISIIAVFIIVGFIMRYSLNKINKQNIIETIRNENI